MSSLFPLIHVLIPITYCIVEFLAIINIAINLNVNLSYVALISWFLMLGYRWQVGGYHCGIVIRLLYIPQSLDRRCGCV